MRKRTLRSWVIFFVNLGLISVGATILSFFLFTLANFSDHANRFFFYVKTNDAEMAKKELVSLHYFYELSRKWKVQKFADQYLFHDSIFYETADSYLIKDWEDVQKRLKDKLDDSNSYPYGNSRFREKKYKFQGKEVSLEDALKFVLAEVADDYEKALRSCLDSRVPYIQCYDRVWNYDLATNKKDAEEALKSPKPQVKYILGPPKVEDKQVPGKPDGTLPGGGIEPGEKPGSGGPTKRP